MIMTPSGKSEAMALRGHVDKNTKSDPDLPKTQPTLVKLAEVTWFSWPQLKQHKQSFLPGLGTGVRWSTLLGQYGTQKQRE